MFTCLLMNNVVNRCNIESAVVQACDILPEHKNNNILAMSCVKSSKYMHIVAKLAVTDKSLFLDRFIIKMRILQYLAGG